MKVSCRGMLKDIIQSCLWTRCRKPWIYSSITPGYVPVIFL